MAAQAETLVNMFHSPDRDMTLQAFTGSESLSGDAIESLGAEVFRGAFNYFN